MDAVVADGIAVQWAAAAAAGSSEVQARVLGALPPVRVQGRPLLKGLWHPLPGRSLPEGPRPRQNRAQLARQPPPPQTSSAWQA